MAGAKVDPNQYFELLAKLGEGSYGSVFKARDKRDGKTVAIKVLEVDKDSTRELQKEINILKECHSEYVVAYYGSYEEKNNIWIVMEYCGPGSLCDLMAICDKTLNEEQIAVVMRQCLYGLKYLHANKKIHRDIKSGNILLTEEGDCKLADFGVSAELTSTIAKRKTVIGTPYWMAPEVLLSSEYDGRADIWSLAITAIELAVGEPPNSNIHPMRAIFLIPQSEPPTLPEPSKWSKEFNDFLKVCLQKDPKNRPTAEQLLKTSPFITRAKTKKTIANLVAECMAEIEEFREAESKDGEGDVSNLDGKGTFGSDISTLDTDKDKGDGKQAPADAAATMRSGASVDSGTMVSVSSGNHTASAPMNAEAAAVAAAVAAASARPAAGASAHSTASSAISLSLAGEPSDSESDPGSPTTPNVHRLPGQSLAQQPAPSSTPVVWYYSTARQLDVNKDSSVAALRAQAVSLSAGYDSELQALEKFYAERRAILKTMIATKQASSAAVQMQQANSRIAAAAPRPAAVAVGGPERLG